MLNPELKAINSFKLFIHFGFSEKLKKPVPIKAYGWKILNTIRLITPATAKFRRRIFHLLSDNLKTAFWLDINIAAGRRTAANAALIFEAVARPNAIEKSTK